MTATRNFVDGLRSEIKNLPAYNSGLSAEHVRTYYGISKVAKLGSNENPFGPSPRVVKAIADAAADSALYPDPGSDDLRTALSLRLEIPPERFAFGNGSEDLISVCAHAFLAPGEEMVTILPSFGLHAIYGQAAGAKVQMIPVEPDYRLNIDKVIAAITPATRMVMFSSPSNPVGTTVTGNDLRRLLEALDQRTLLIFDEAYFEYASLDAEYPGFLGILEASKAAWILLRTFSKAYGLAGLRVGYAVASDASLVQIIDRARTPFNVNRLAQVGALAALDEVEYVRESVGRTVKERERVQAALINMGFPPAPSVANFLFFDARENASELAARLLPHGVIVKPWREPGFSQHIRVSIGSPRANDQFLEALGKEANANK